MILALKTEGELTQIYLFDSSGGQLAKRQWQSGRGLAEALLNQILKVLQEHKAGLPDLTGLIVFRGPGSFTGLRIGIATVNALAYALAAPNVGSEGEAWLGQGLKLLAKQNKPQIITPIYDREPNITRPKR